MYNLNTRELSQDSKDSAAQPFELPNMENAENQSFKANRPMGYSIQFEPEKPKAPAPKCVTEYYSKIGSKPTVSPKEIREKLDRAAFRKKTQERAKLARMHQCQERVRKLDEKLRPFLDAMMRGN